MRNDTWQFGEVEPTGATTSHAKGLCKSCNIEIESLPYPDGYSILSGLSQGDTISVASPAVVIRLGLPSDTDLFELTGAVKVVFTQTHFSRDVNDATDDNSVSLVLPSAERDSVKYALSFNNCAEGYIYYATVFYETTAGVWAYDAYYGIDRVMVRGKMGAWGKRLFELMPRYTRYIDTQNQDSLYKLMTLIGCAFDDIEPLIANLNNAYDVETIDASLLPYIDRLLGWPTNFELSEELRRAETLQAVSLFRAKGSARALELVIQRTLGWDVEIYSGRDYVLTTNKAPLPTQPPDDWVEGEIDPDSTLPVDQQATGIWSSMRSTGLATWSPRDSASIFSPLSTVMLLPATSGWKNINGVLVRIFENESARVGLTSVAIKKINNLLNLFIPAFADAYFMITSKYAESLRLNISDEFSSDGNDEDGELFRLKVASEYVTHIPITYFGTHPLEATTNDTAYKLPYGAV